MKGFFKELKSDHNYLLTTHGLKNYVFLVLKLFGYLILNPIITIMFFVYGHYILCFLWFFFTVFGYLLVFDGKKIIRLLQEWQFRRYMKKMEKKR